MGLSVKSGRFTTGTGTGDVAVTGVGFQPKAVILQMTQCTATDTYTTGTSRCIGFLGVYTEGGGAKQARCIVTQSQNNVGTTATDHGHHTGACLLHMNTSGTIDGVAVAPAGSVFQSDGFTINITDAMPGNYQVEYLAFGGDDLSGVSITNKEFDGGTYTGDWTGIGFQPDLMFFLTTGSGMDTSVNPNVDLNGKFAFGVAKSATERACIYHWDNDADANVEGGTFLAARAIAGPRSTSVPTHEFEVDLAAKSAWPSDGIEFTASLGGTATQNDTIIFGLFLRGSFSSKIGLTNTPTSDSNLDTDVGFAPKMGMVFSDCRAAHAGLNTTDADGFTLGWFDGTNQACVTHSDNDGNTTSTCRVIHDITRIAKMEDAVAASNPSEIGRGVGAFPGGTTFRVGWTLTTATARQYAYLVMGDAPAILPPPFRQVSTLYKR